jgi:hypothetical protein
MQRYYETIRVINVASGKSHVPGAVLRPAPAARKLTALAYHHVWERLTEPAARRVWSGSLSAQAPARVSRRLRSRVRTPRVNLRLMCAYIPVSSQRDLRCFDLSHEAREDLGEVDAEPQLAVRHGMAG